MNLQLIMLLIGIITLTSFILAYRNIKWALVILTPILVSLIALSIFKYDDMAGYPKKMSYDEIPETINVIFYKIKNDKLILWIELKDTTRLIELPRNKQLETILEKSSDKMRGGKQIKIKTVEANISNNSGYHYIIESEGQAIEGSLPPK